MNLVGPAEDRVPSLALCMIVRDEAERLARCLESVAGVVDELVVVDTGSRDGTPEIAAGFGARVVPFPWVDDFSAARNRSLEAATSDWILVLDADEVVVDEAAREKLIAFARSGERFAGQVELENLTAGGARSRILLSRFLPRDPAIRYERRVHEQLVRAGKPFVGRPTGVRVRHDGYTDEAIDRQGKLERNAALLRAELGERPSDGYDWYQLGRTLEVAGRHADALAAYERSVESAKDEDPHLPHLFECAATCLRQLDRSAQALAWLGEVEHAYTERADMVFLAALLAMDVGDFERAERGYLRCLELGARKQAASAVESSSTAATSAPAHNLGVLYEFTGRPAEARAAYERALRFDPGLAGARAGLERLAASRERVPGE